MPFDPVTSLRIVNNQRLMRDTHRGQYRDLGGALALTSDAPLPQWNCLEGFTTDAHRIDGLLDIGLALLRAFDQPPAVRLTPLDRPPGIDARLAQRGLVESRRETSFVFRGAAAAAKVNRQIQVKRAEPEDASVFASLGAQVNAPKEKWAKGFLLGAALANILEPAHAFYLAHDDGEPAGGALTVSADGVTGIYSVATLRAHRRRGIGTALTVRAVTEAQAAGADIVCLECESGSDAMQLYASLGFEPAHEASLWTARNVADV
jgi:ribosomal protein S18 acetylase RimI-like enzyme